MARLGVNIDHVATLRQLRGTPYPSIAQVATLCLQEGADQVTIHLREDRRHIQDTDVEAVRLVTKRFGKPLNLEMGCNEEIIEVAVVLGPDWVCLVPERRQEVTTEGGLNLLDSAVYEKVKNTIRKLRQSPHGIKISLFLEADEKILQRAQELKPDAVEIHTGEYARAFADGEDCDQYLELFRQTVKWLCQRQIHPHAGHGLTNESVEPLARENLFEEYNIGHWVVCQAVLDGLAKTVKDLKNLVADKEEMKA
jgi:pyridoxine 5-phosphate synthase